MDRRWASRLDRPLVSLLALLLASCGERAEVAPRVNFTTLEAGQVWTYLTRPGEEDSRLTILVLDPDNEVGPTVHVALDGLHVRNPQTPGGISTTIAHLPMGEDALRGSLVALVGHAPGPLDLSGYDEWKDAYDHGSAGSFSRPVAEVVGLAEAAMASR